MVTRFTEPLFRQSLPAILDLTGLSHGELKEATELYATRRGQREVNFKAGWQKWENGKTTMPVKIEAFLRTFYGDRFEEPGSVIGGAASVQSPIAEPQDSLSYQDDPRWKALIAEYSELQGDYSKLTERTATVAEVLSKSAVGSILDAVDLQSLARSIARSTL